MILRNGRVFVDGERFEELDLRVENGVVAELAPAGSLAGEGLDAAGGFILPGLVDIHTHGCVNYDFCDADPVGMAKMLAYYGAEGVTSVVPATMSFNEPVLNDVLDVAIPLFDREGHGAVLRGVNMEGPFIALSKKGAQNPEYIVDPSLAMFRSLQARCGGRIKLVDIAPELPGSIEFTKAVAGECVVSLAHTDANYSEAMAAFAAGASHVTHLFNAMPPFTHRQPGVIGAASDAAKSVEVISDGIHLHPAVVRAAFQWFGRDRVCLISDSMRATGMPNGEYSLGGQKVLMQDGKATLEDGTIAGSATCLAEMLRRAIGFGVPVEDAVRAATLNPARVAKLDGLVGSIAKGKRADILVWDAALHTTAVLCGGERLG